MEEYLPKAKTTSIKFSSRISLNIKDTFYTVEYGEERTIDFDNVDLDKERQALINDCNYQIDSQAELIRNTFGKS